MKTIFFGNYWQSNSSEKEPIEWIVLNEEDDKMYLLSKFCLDCVPYNIKRASSWEKSHLRKWLNAVFINNAFSIDEQNKIILSDIKSSAWFGYWFGEEPSLDYLGPVCKDKIFVPSISEAIIYFGSEKWHDIDSEQRRIARPTNYAYENGGCCVYCLEYSPLKYTALYLYDDVNISRPYWHICDDLLARKEPLGENTPYKRWASNWYLRSPEGGVVKVSADGIISSHQIKNLEHTAVRPAMWVKK